MNDYLNQTEEQEFENAKSWFKENGTPIIVAVAVIAASVAGWNFWKSYQQNKIQEASASYQAVMESYEKDPAKNQLLVEKFIKDNTGTNYATFSALELAKQAVKAGDFAKAQTVLTEALNSAEDETLANVIRIRLAEVKFQLKDYDNAIATLDQVNSEAWNLRKALLKGDILATKGDANGAKALYEEAKKLAPVEKQALIDIRLNNL